MGFALKYKLIQQTPLIHFQHDQKGATLRATEVKPKLDKFIIEKMGWKDKLKNDKERKDLRKEYGDWFIGDSDALNYKLRIITTGEPCISHMIDREIAVHRAKQRDVDKYTKNQLERARNAEINGMFFGNMVSGKEDYEEKVRSSYKETVFYEGDDKIKLEVICFVTGLKQEIEKHIEEFFIVNNFGTRQSKGFGGFVAVRDGADSSSVDPVQLLVDNKYRFFYVDVSQNSQYPVMLNHAKNIYAVMKGGYNHTKFDPTSKYIKGYVQRCFIDGYFSKDVGSDKAFIKKYMRTMGEDPYSEKYSEFIFSRALLGLADYYEFRDRVRRGRVDIFGFGDNGFNVERFKSPITIKIIGNKLIFLFGSFDEICNKTFYFSPNGIPSKTTFDKKTTSEKRDYILNNPSIFKKIETPKKFDDEDIVLFINDFAEYFMKERSKFSTYRDNLISCSSRLNIIIPPYLRREI